MGKMIAVCGAPGSGKTTAALKIAEEIYYAKKGSAIFLSPDLNVPCLAFIFPNCKEEELYSVGVALDRTDIYREDVLRQMNHVKTMENFGFLGYKAGENKYSYPRPTEDKILNLFSILRELADYVIIDCADGLISSMAKSHADMLVQLITPDLKCMAYYSSNSGMFELGAENRIKVMNISDKDLFLPITEVANHFKGVDFTLPYGISFVVAGATSSGKTTLLNALLTSIPDNKRIFTIESGSRELSLVKVKDGEVINNVVHTLSRPSDNPAYDITQEDLVVASLRFNPDIVVVGEMRDTEAYSAVEASLTGHTVVSTIHASAADAAHMRLALLCQKRFPINFATSLMQAGQAFPLVVYAHKLEDNSRKIMDISECVITPSGEREYHTLFRFRITKNELKRGKYKIDGYFEQPEIMSDHLKGKLMQFGVPQKTLEQFLVKDGDFK